MILVQLSDFTGQYQLPRTNQSDAIFQSYIDREETLTIYKLLGQVLGDLIIAYLAANKTPSVIRYDNILNSFYIQNTTAFGSQFYARQTTNQEPPFYVSTGLKDLLINDIFYYYITETMGLKVTQAGIANAQVDTLNSVGASNTYRFAEQKWNKSGYDTWLAIWWRCFVYENSIYPEFQGILPIVKYGSLF